MSQNNQRQSAILFIREFLLIIVALPAIIATILCLSIGSYSLTTSAQSLIPDRIETKNFGDGSIDNPFSSLVDARVNVDIEGVYNFDVSNEVFTSYVDEDGWVLVASGEGDTLDSSYNQTNTLTLNSDAILTSQVVDALNATELRMTSENGAVDVITSHHENLALFDAYRNFGSGIGSQSEWSGVGVGLLGNNDGKNTSDLDKVIFDSDGESDKLHWVPQDGLENPSGPNSTSNQDMNLWARGNDSALLSVPSTVSGQEDSSIPLNFQADPTITEGGSHQDIIETAYRYRAASSTASSTTFDIPELARFAKITSYGGNNEGEDSAAEEDYQTTSLVVDLSRNTYSGHIFHVRNQSSQDNDDYAFSEIPLGEASDSGNIVGDDDNTINSITLSKNAN